jgi:hypothetical protein
MDSDGPAATDEETSRTCLSGLSKRASEAQNQHRRRIPLVLLFYTEDKARLSAVMASAGLPEVRFRYDFGGNRVM